MLANFYQKNIIEKPKLIFSLLIICLVFFGYYSKDFRLDASSDTLLIEGDPDLKYLNEINDRYGAKEFLVLTYTPNKSMIEQTSIENLIRLKNEIQKLIRVERTETHFKYEDLCDVRFVPLLEGKEEDIYV